MPPAAGPFAALPPSAAPWPSEIGGYVLAGGRSSRMGSDKALLELAGKPLIAHAVTKLRRVAMGVRILSANPALAAYATLVPDLHPNCGPIGGIEAALLHTVFDWNLILPVDVPLLPTALLDHWLRSIVAQRSRRIRVASFRVFGVLQPTLLMIHRDAAPYFSQAIAEGRFKLTGVLEAVAKGLALPGSPIHEQVPFTLPVDEHLIFGGWQPGLSGRTPGSSWMVLTESQRAAQPLWFANLNTPEEFAEAEKFADALDT